MPDAVLPLPEDALHKFEIYLSENVNGYHNTNTSLGSSSGELKLQTAGV